MDGAHDLILVAVSSFGRLDVLMKDKSYRVFVTTMQNKQVVVEVFTVE